MYRLFSLYPCSSTFLMACWHCWCRRDKTLVWSASAVWTQLETRQNCCLVCSCVHSADADKTKLSCLVRVSGVNKLLVANWKLGRDETKLVETGSRQDKIVLSCPCRPCEQGRNCLVSGVNKPLVPRSATFWIDSTSIVILNFLTFSFSINYHFSFILLLILCNLAVLVPLPVDCWTPEWLGFIACLNFENFRCLHSGIVSCRVVMGRIEFDTESNLFILWWIVHHYLLSY